MSRRRLMIVLWASMILFLAACGSEAVEQAQVVSVTPSPVATTAPLSVPTLPPDPTPTPVPQATATPLPQATATPLPAATVAPTAAAPAEAAEVVETPTAAAPAEVVETPTAIAAVEATETPTSVATPIAEEPATEQEVGSETTPVAETPTTVLPAPGEPPLECYDAEVRVYRAFVEGVDDLKFEGGRVYCSGAGSNAVSAAGSYRHSSGLVISRNADYIFNEAGTAYIPYSGSVHFCINGQPSSAPVRADTVPALLIVIDAEAQSQLAQGASGPVEFTSSGSRC